MNFDLHQVIIQIIAFLLMLWILRKFGWGPLNQILEDRRTKIQLEIQTIAAEKEKFQSLQKEYEDKIQEIDQEARAKIQAIVKEAESIADSINKETLSKSKELLEQTKHQITREYLYAKQQLKSDLVEMVIETSKMILTNKIDSVQDNALIERFLEEKQWK